MKAVKRNLKWAAKILSFLILLQSCTVYHKYSSSVDEAIAANDKVKLQVPEDDPYKFLKLVRIENEIYGVAKRNSHASKELNGRIVDTSYEGKYNLIKLSEEDQRNIHVKNKGASTALSIVIPVVLVGAVVGIAVATADIGPNIQWTN